MVARCGINVRDVQDVIELAIGGRAASTLYEGERRFDITVPYVPEARTDPVATGISSDVQHPLATVVVGGPLSTPFLTLLALPSLYYLVAKRRGNRSGLQVTLVD